MCVCVSPQSAVFYQPSQLYCVVSGRAVAEQLLAVDVNTGSLQSGRCQLKAGQ